MRKFIGVDLGGTNVRVAVVNEIGDILEDVKSPSLSDQGPEVVLDNIIKMIDSLKHKDNVLGIGLGIPGPVDTENGYVTLATNIKDFAYFPVVKYLKDRLNLPVFMDNDANVAGLAEAMVGAGKGEKIVYYVTHSTGIGGALVVNGQVVSGNFGYAGEIANIIIDRSREKVNHLNAGAVENWAAGEAMVRQARERISEDIDSAAAIFALAQDNHPVATEIIETMITDFALMLSTIAHVVEPHVFVIGGGVSKSANLYLNKVIEQYNTMVHPGMRNTKFELAKLDEPGVIGAAMLCYGIKE